MAETTKALGLSCCVLLLIVICFALPISMIVIGAKYEDDCPVEHKIPIWLIVSGAVALFQGIFAPAFQSDGHSERSRGRIIFQALGLIVNVFQVVWFIVGSVWVYSNYKPSYNENDPNYCEKTVFLFSFWILNITYIGLCLTLIVSGALLVYNRGL